MLSRLFDLGGKVALVTGGSRGLGRAMVLAFAEAGADVVIASRKLASCEATADEVRKATGRRALPVACHVGHWGQVEALADRAYAEFGRVDVLVNNAGMSPLYDRIENVTEELWDKVLDVNLKARSASPPWWARGWRPARVAPSSWYRAPRRCDPPPTSSPTRRPRPRSTR